MAQDIIRRRFTSNAQAAAHLHRQWKRQASDKAENVSEPSLATKIGELARGKAQWWSRRPELTRLLADALDCEPEELLGRSVVPADALRFPEFPTLPPLRSGEAPCAMRREGWLTELVVDVLQRQVSAVIVAGPGMGKSFVVRWLAAHPEYDCVALSTASLEGATPQVAEPRPLVIDIDELDPRTDPDCLRVLRQRTHPTILLTPCAWESHQPKGWERHEAVFDARARDRFVWWISQRIERSERDTRLDPEHLLNWLRVEDPTLRLVATPADLLALCADLDAAGSELASWQTRARRWLRGVAPGLFEREPPPWARHLDEFYDALCRGALTRVEHTWGALPRAIWPTLLPNSLRGPDNGRWGCEAIVNELQRASLLRGAPNGLALAPTWVLHGLTTAALDRMVEEQDAEAWGIFAADVSRQPLVDATLERRPDAAFCATVRAVVHPRARRTLGLIAAREAVFTAAARRLARRDFVVPPADVDVWRRLARQQIDTLATTNAWHHPWTRRDLHDIYALWADGWTFSLRLPRPEGFERADLAWHFPGWFEQLDPPQDHHWPSSSIDPAQADGPVRRMIYLAREVLPKMTAPPEGHELPRLLLPAAILLSQRLTWRPSPRTLRQLSGTWEGQFLARAIPRLPATERARMADMLWDNLKYFLSDAPKVTVTRRLQALTRAADEFRPFILENLSVDALIRTIEQDGLYDRESDIHGLRQFPRALRRQIVQKELALGGGWSRARAVAPLLEFEDIDLLEQIIRESEAEVAAEFTQFVWQRAPSRAKSEAIVAIAEGRASAYPWLFHAPRALLAELVAQLRRRPLPLPEWVAKWAQQRLLDSGPAAEDLFDLAAPDYLRGDDPA